MTDNKTKILDVVKTLEKPITTTELAELTNIDISNITRYLKALEKDNLIERNTIQEGKKRIVLITSRKNIPKIEKPVITLEEKPKEIKIDQKTIKKAKIEPIESSFDINIILEDLSKTSEFKRLIYKALIGRVHRGSSENLDNELSLAIQKFRVNF